MAVREKNESTTEAKDVLSGKIIFGKYIFLIRLSLETIELLDCRIIELKQFQAINPATK